MAKHLRHSLVRHLVFPIALASLAGSLGCVKWMRDPEFFRDQLDALIEAHNGPIEACYDRTLEQDPKAAGVVVVDFQIEKQTGVITEIRVDPAQTTAPEGLVRCVTDELANARLDPVDAKTAVASHRWEFVPGSRKQPPADPFAEAQPAVLGCYSDYLAKVDRAATGVLVVDYAFDRASGTVSALEVVGEGTTAPQPVVDCAAAALRAAKLDPAKLEDRNAAGRRSFTLQFTPYVEG